MYSKILSRTYVLLASWDSDALGRRLRSKVQPPRSQPALPPQLSFIRLP